jgi:hypothetical protein
MNKDRIALRRQGIQYCAESVAAGSGGGGKLDAAGGLVAGKREGAAGLPGIQQMIHHFIM